MPGRFLTIAAFLSSDHQRLAALLNEVCDLVDRGELVRAGQAFAQLHAGLGRHIHIEEDLLFPLLEQRSPTGPTEVMRREHRMVERALAVMESGISERRDHRFREGLHLLLQIVPHHDAKEERVLCPMLDGLLSGAERRALVEQLARLNPPDQAALERADGGR